VAGALPPPGPEGLDIAELKAQLLDSLFGTERGISASSELRAEINELISQLEANNPNPLPNEVGGLPSHIGLSVLSCCSWI
jgi:PAP_fibrillin